MLLGAAIFPDTSKYGGGPEKMAIVAAKQRWRRCLGESSTAGFWMSAGRKAVAHFIHNCSGFSIWGLCKALINLIYVRV